MTWVARNEAEQAAADRAVSFFSLALTHVKGEWAGQPLELQEWAYDEIIRPLFGTLNEDGTRQYRTVYVEVARKNAKSTIAAGVALYLLVADNEPGAEVYSAAADKDQAAIVFDMARQMVEQGPLRKRCRVLRKSITVQKLGASYKAISADAYTKHGLNAHGVVFDEVHAQKSRDLWDVLTTSTGARRQPVVFGITTAGVYDPESICWELHDYALKVRDGVIDDPTFLPVIYAADEEDDWQSPEVWAKANPGLGVTVKNDYLAREARRAAEIPAAQNTFRRLHLNQWTSQDSRWLDMGVWDENAGEANETALLGRECWGGLDLSTNTDLSALALVFPGDTWHVLMRFWIPEDSIQGRVTRDRVPYDAWKRDGWLTTTPGNVVDYGFIRAEVNEIAERYDLRELAYDPWNATQLAVQLENDDGLPMVAHRQGFISMSAPCREVEKLLLGRQLAHGGHPVLKWNANNIAVKVDESGNMRPAKNKSAERIDGLVALIMAVGRASFGGGGVEPSVYETRELLVL